MVATDFMGPDKKIYGAPLSVDSLALYYNKDIFTAAGINEIPFAGFGAAKRTPLD